MQETRRRVQERSKKLLSLERFLRPAAPAITSSKQQQQQLTLLSARPLPLTKKQKPRSAVGVKLSVPKPVNLPSIKKVSLNRSN